MENCEKKKMRQKTGKPFRTKTRDKQVNRNE